MAEEQAITPGQVLNIPIETGEPRNISCNVPMRFVLRGSGGSTLEFILPANHLISLMGGNDDWQISFEWLEELSKKGIHAVK